jgi:hypothetical protein
MVKVLCSLKFYKKKSKKLWKILKILDQVRKICFETKFSRSFEKILLKGNDACKS